MIEVKGRVIYKGRAEGIGLVTKQAISFYGGVDPQTGVVTEKEHELEGKSIAGKILVFPQGKGSTVGSYIMYRLKKNGHAPAGIINRECEPIVAVGAIIGEIPMIDKLERDIYGNLNGKKVIIDRDKIIVKD
jgi:predicted aconitase with swiveling domain